MIFRLSQKLATKPKERSLPALPPRDGSATATSTYELGEITCFNTEGKDWLGRPFAKRLSVGRRGRIQPMWFGVQIPHDAAPGEYWDPSCPLKTGRSNLFATAYVRAGKTLVSVASWAY